MNQDKVSANLIMRLRRATGLPVLDAKRVLMEHDADDRLAFVTATENQPRTSGMARDPQEDDDVLGPIIHATLDAVTERVVNEYDEHIAEMRKATPAMADFLSNRRGICHRIWAETKKHLNDEHGVEWRTPAEINPGTIFD